MLRWSIAHVLMSQANALLPYISLANIFILLWASLMPCCSAGRNCRNINNHIKGKDIGTLSTYHKILNTNHKLKSIFIDTIQIQLRTQIYTVIQTSVLKSHSSICIPHTACRTTDEKDSTETTKDIFRIYFIRITAVKDGCRNREITGTWVALRSPWDTHSLNELLKSWTSVDNLQSSALVLPNSIYQAL